MSAPRAWPGLRGFPGWAPPRSHCPALAPLAPGPSDNPEVPLTSGGSGLEPERPPEQSSWAVRRMGLCLAPLSPSGPLPWACPAAPPGRSQAGKRAQRSEVRMAAQRRESTCWGPARGPGKARRGQAGLGGRAHGPSISAAAGHQPSCSGLAPTQESRPGPSSGVPSPPCGVHAQPRTEARRGGAAWHAVTSWAPGPSSLPSRCCTGRPG